ncbi:MAG: sensor histidine kinase [Phormidesmis sp.]
MSSHNQSNSAMLGAAWLSHLKVNQRITLGFSLALGLSFAGTGIGILVGSFYQDRALATESLARERINILSSLQAGVLQTRTHQQQLIPLSESPTDFQEEYSHILKHSATIRTVWGNLNEFLEEKIERGRRDETSDITKLVAFIETYDGVPSTYLEELDSLVTSLSPNALDTAEDISNTQQQLLSFTNSDLAITFDGISDELSDIISDANTQLEIARQNADAAQRLHNWVILLSMVLSAGSAALLAFVISRSISKPLEAMEKTALDITQNDRFSLRAEVSGNDEVGTVATSFNLLLERVENLLQEQRKRTEELTETNLKLVSTRNQMVAQEKLASLGSLTAGIAHEIKNPLNFVNNFSELSVELADELNEEFDAQKDHIEAETFSEITEILEVLRGNLRKIDHHGKRADKIVASMLMHSRSGATEWTDVDINASVSDAINLAYHGMRAKQSDFNLEFDTDYAENLATIQACPQDLNRVFLNIANNACYAIYQRQLVESKDFTPRMKVRTRDRGEAVEVHIRDNGTGMPPEIQAKIFDQFFTTKPAGEGTGLGLSLSYGIITEQHKGTMQVESEEGIYTDFIIMLPKRSIEKSEFRESNA